MAIAKKRGDSWRCQVYIGKDPETGKNVYKSFTAATKKAAEWAASQYVMQQPDNRPENITFSQALERHIKNKSAIIAPTTLVGYKKLQRTAYKTIDDAKIADINQETVQAWANEYAASHAPKSLKNAHGLLVSVLKTFKPNLILRTSLPARKKVELVIPTEHQVTQLIDAADPEMMLPIMLAAKAGLRRSEIGALTYDSINFKAKTMAIIGALVKDSNKTWVLKDTKTYAGNRTVPLSDDIIIIIKQRKKAGLPLVSVNPDVMTKRFASLRIKQKLPPMRFHDLRHFYASVLLTLGVPDVYVARIMGHETIEITKRIYVHIMEDKQSNYNQTVAKYFSELDKNAP